MQKSKPVELRRSIRLPQATALVAGTIIGSAIFVQPSVVTGLVPSVGGSLMVWLLSGLLTLAGALACAELASMFTRSGGVYLYLRESFSPAVGFLWGWAMFWVMHSGIIAAIAVVFARYLGYFIPLEVSGMKIAAIACIFLLSAINMAGVQYGSTLQTVITAAKVLAIVLIVLAGFVLGSRLPAHFVADRISVGAVKLENILLAISAGLFTYGGWHMVAYNAEETVEPQKTVPRALVLGTLLVTACYMAMAAVYMYILPIEQVATSQRIAADAADALLGFGGGAIMSGLVVISTFGALTGIILAGPRVYYAMAQDGLLFAWAGSIHPHFRTPIRALILQAIWASILLATGTYEQFVRQVIYTEWIFLGLMALGLMRLRQRGVPRRYSVWGYPFVPVVFALASFAIVANHIVTRPGESLLGLGFVLLGLPVYCFWKNRISS